MKRFNQIFCCFGGENVYLSSYSWSCGLKEGINRWLNSLHISTHRKLDRLRVQLFDTQSMCPMNVYADVYGGAYQYDILEVDATLLATNATANHILVCVLECNLQKDAWKTELKNFSNKNGYDIKWNGDSGPLLLDVLEAFLIFEGNEILCSIYMHYPIQAIPRKS